MRRCASTLRSVAVVSESFAERFWPGEDAIGRRVITRRHQRKPLTVIGIVGDVRDVSCQPSRRRRRSTSRTSRTTSTAAPVSLVVRTAGDPLAHHQCGSRRRAVGRSGATDRSRHHRRAVSRRIRWGRSGSEARCSIGARRRSASRMAAVGVYGVTARAVQERTQELGVRLALGASQASLVRTVVWQTLRAVVAGLLVGAALSIMAAVALLRALPDLVWNAMRGPQLPAIALLAITAAAAATIPARRAASLDPLIALRSE